jgi:hypothetical protein
MSKIQYSPTEKLLIKIEKTIKSPRISEQDLNFLCSVSSFYLINKRLTPKQTYTANKVVNKYKVKRAASKPKKYQLYAISSGDSVKLGFTSDLKGRLRSLQVGNSSKLKLTWKYLVKGSRQDAVRAEKKLHKFCSEFRVRGEWFKPECIDKVKKFKP